VPPAEPNTAPGGSPIRGYPLAAAAAEETDDEGDVVIVERPPVRGVMGRAARCAWCPFCLTTRSPVLVIVQAVAG